MLLEVRMTIRQTTARLENGDVMSREEFHRLYSECEGLERVELIEGVVYMPSPIRFEGHAQEQGLMLRWLFAYAAKHSDVECSPPGSVLLDDQNEPEPDAMLFRMTPNRLEDGYVSGAPELVVEIAASSKSRDLHQKKRAYERNGVLDYIVWRTEDQAIDWFELRDGAYVARKPDARGIIESRQFPGLRLAMKAMLAKDRVAILAALE
jgi:Uma2 family endonuclease